MSHSTGHINKRQERWNICAAYCLATYLLSLCPMLWFTISELLNSDNTIGSVLCLLTGLFSMTGMLLLPVWGAAMLGKDFPNAQSRGRHLLRKSCWYISGIFLGWVWCYIGSDIAIYHHFGFHFNGLVLNLLTTRGGFEAMGLDGGTIFLAGIGIAIIQFAGIFTAHLFISSHAIRRRCGALLCTRRLFLSWTALPAAALTVTILLTAFGEFYNHSGIVNAADAYPLGLRLQMSTLMQSVGIENVKTAPAVTHLELPDPNQMIPEYPLIPISRKTPEKPLNIVWLACESLRTEMFDAKYMPVSSSFIASHGIRFSNHYSGGNGTRPSVFSMFYGLYATAWEPFLKAQRGSLLFDWLLEDDYQLLLQTSARFTYPEFDRTIFSALPWEYMVEEDRGTPWQRDIHVVDRLLKFIENAEPGRPFFGFIFFDSTHAPYSYPPDKQVFTPVMEEFSYTSLGPEMREQVYNRAANAAYHLDSQISRIIGYLQKHNLLENTIVIITGDHGEEFYEKGRLGHNSDFVDQQIKTPLAMFLPGQPARVYQGISHHSDILPTIAPYLGVASPPSDYSCGGDLLNDDYHRQNLIVCGWRTAVFVNPGGKLLLPINPHSKHAAKRFLNQDDNYAPQEEMDNFYNLMAAEIQEEAQQLYKCLQSPLDTQKNSSMRADTPQR